MFYPFILMDIQAGQRARRSLDAARRTSRRCRGAAGSRWRRRRGGRGRPTRRRRRRPRSRRSSAGRAPATFDASGDDGRVSRAGGMVLSALRAALCASLRAGGRGRCLLHRLGDARPDADPRLGATAIRRCGRSCDLAEEVRAILGPDAKIGYAADWSEYFGHQPARRVGRRPLPPRSAVGVAGDRFRRHRQLHAAVRLARRQRAMPTRRRGRSTTSTT